MFESSTDRDREARTLEALAAAVGRDWGQYPIGYPVDGWLHHGQQLTTFVEVKGVTKATSDLSHLVIQVDKVDALWRHAQFVDASRIVAFAFTDEIRVIHVDDLIRLAEPRMYGRTDRGRDERQPCLRVRTDQITTAVPYITPKETP